MQELHVGLTVNVKIVKTANRLQWGRKRKKLMEKQIIRGQMKFFE